MVVLRPLVAALTWITNGLDAALRRRATHDKTPFVTEDELRLLVEVGEEEGVLEEEEREMIDNVFDSRDTAVREVMVPRIDMVTVEADATIDEATQVILQGGQSRIPVYDDTHRQHHRRALRQRPAACLRRARTPDGARAWCAQRTSCQNPSGWMTCCVRCSKQRVHMAIVVDEYGSVARAGDHRRPGRGDHRRHPGRV